MSKEKQIEEIADVIDADPNAYDTYRRSHCEQLAEIIYNAGYRKQSEGEWVDQYHGEYANQLYKCSVCGGKAHNDEDRWFLTPFCPNCGAKMGGGE